VGPVNQGGDHEWRVEEPVVDRVGHTAGEPSFWFHSVRNNSPLDFHPVWIFLRQMLMTERFWAKVNKTDGCWLWTGMKNDYGYGRLFTGTQKRPKPIYAHRLSWTIHFGPIPHGLHLWLGTQRDNMDDMDRKGRRRNVGQPGESNPSAKLTMNDVPTIRELKANGVSFRQLGKRFGVSSSTIFDAVKQRNWKDPIPTS
jgi:hypothetical protein